MKQKFFFIISSLFLVFTLFVGAPVSQVYASESDLGVENQQKSKRVTIVLDMGIVPPKVIFHETNDGYAGYIGLVEYYYDGKRYFATYRRMVYDRPPYPAPVGMFLGE